jgi:cellulose synthase/poly-beta-1,6-N-acetylglucosamine synthase-like glycosyltransferase
MTEVFWLSLAFVAYVYAGYPLLLELWARRRRGAATNAGSHAERQLPGVSIVIAAHNEGSRLAARIDNLRSLDYPPACRQIIVVSDGSTDDSAAIVRRYAPEVELVEVSRGGKALALNVGVSRARFDLVVFADARQVFAPDALRQLAAPFADPAIGAVTGELLLDCESALFANRRAEEDRRRDPNGRTSTAAGERRRTPDRRLSIVSSIADGVGLYWRYEKHLRRAESAVGSTLGATGAIYAMRRSLWRPLPADTILDDVLTPMRVVLAGYRVVFNEQARAFDRAPLDAEMESRRKIRTLAGNYQILWLEPRLLLPWRNPVWFQYSSHKLGRLLAPYALLGVFIASVPLSVTSVFYSSVLAGEVLFVVLAGYGAWLEYRGRLSTVPVHHPLGSPARDTA